MPKKPVLRVDTSRAKAIIKKEVRKQIDINTEDKFYDVVINLNGQNNLVEDLLAGITAGTDDDQRVGRKIKVKSIFYKFRLQLPTNYADRMVTRIDLILKKDTDGAMPAGSGVYTTDSSLALRNMDNSKNVRVLRSHANALFLPWEYYNTGTSAVVKGQPIRYIEYMRRFKRGLTVTYKPGQAMPEYNGLFMLLTTDFGTITNSELIAVGEARIRYEDA